MLTKPSACLRENIVFGLGPQPIGGQCHPFRTRMATTHSNAITIEHILKQLAWETL